MEPPRKPQGITPHAHFLQDACDTMRANRIVPGVGYRLREGPGGTALEIPRRGNAKWFHPFKIYKAGELRYQVRSGYVGFRSNAGVFNSPAVTNNKPISDNGETVLWVTSGSDGVVDLAVQNDFWTASTALSQYYSKEELAVANTGDTGVIDPANAAIFTLNSDTDGTGGIFAAFWVEIADDTTPAAEIKCRMWAFDAGATGRTLVPFSALYGNSGDPAQETIVIPIGVVYPNNAALAYNASTNPLVVGQFRSEHLINRYAPGPINPNGTGGTQGPCYWRGNWDDDSLTGLTFYDGDLVSYKDLDDETRLWAHIGIAVETSVGGANWKLAAGTPP